MDIYVYIHIKLIKKHVCIHKHTYIRTYIYVYMHKNLQNSDWLSSVVIRWGGRRGGNRGSNSGVLATLCVSYLLKTCKYILHRCVLYWVFCDWTGSIKCHPKLGCQVEVEGSNRRRRIGVRWGPVASEVEREEGGKTTLTLNGNELIMQQLIAHDCTCIFIFSEV